MSFLNFHDSFIETDLIGCGTQFNRKVPPDESNLSWAHLSLLRRLRLFKNKLGRLSPLSVSRPTLLDLIWNTVFIHFLNWPHVYLFSARLIRISKKRCQPTGKPYFPRSGSGLQSKDKHRSRTRTPFNITGFAGGVIQFITKSHSYSKKHFANGVHYFRYLLRIVFLPNLEKIGEIWEDSTNWIRPTNSS